MQEKLPPDTTASPAAAQLLRDLDDALAKLQERISAHCLPEHTFALIHLVEGLPIEEWQKMAGYLPSHSWLALPLGTKDGVQLLRIREAMLELIHQRDHDTMTGLANRRVFERQINLEVQRAQRTAMPLSLVMIDLDNFKEVNDSYGHHTGDKVLVALGEVLTRSRRAYDVAARVGGEEFCLLLPGATATQARGIAMRALEEFRQISFTAPDGSQFCVTFSAGVATASGSSAPATPEMLFVKADQLLYEAKRSGKNRVASTATRHKISENPALVQVAEKLFLFTGKDA